MVRLCVEFAIAIVPQGGNTNVCRMAVPLPGQDAIVLSLARMNKIIDVNPSANTATAEAGVLMQALQDAARDADRVFAPDWGARGTAMVGGAVATNGGGLNVLRYGTTREQVLGAARHPYTQGLLRSIPSLARRGEPLAEIAGVVPSPEDWPPGCRFATRCSVALDSCAAEPPPTVKLPAGQLARCHVVAREEVR